MGQTQYCCKCGNFTIISHPQTNIATMLGTTKKMIASTFITAEHIQAYTNKWLTVFHNFFLTLNIQQSKLGHPPIVMI